MKKIWFTLCAVALLSAGAAVASPGVQAAPSAPAAPTARHTAEHPSDDLSSPLETRRRALREQAVTQVMNGTAKVEQRNGSRVVHLGANAAGQPGKGNYVELGRETTDHIFVILTEFGNKRHPDYPDQDTSADTPGPVRFDGPLRNQIDQPGRSVDNSTSWKPDYNRKHYEDIYFNDTKESLKTYYQYQSSGRYSVDGTVTDWVKVPYNEARYGRSDGYPCDDSVCANTWELVRDAANKWVADQQAQGKTAAQIKSMLAEFDQWDRYDHDFDGDFNEPDGYLDHFQIVHAGGDQADGDPFQGEDAIWSHRWYAYDSDDGITGPPNAKFGGTQIGSTGIWIGDYTIQPENGGLSVFAHEYGHDLGLPDDYDTAGGDGNPTEWWTLMAQSRLSGANETIDSRAGDIGAWQKLMLGWLDYEFTEVGETKNVELGPAEYNSVNPQALIVELPKKLRIDDYGPPYAGSQMYWSGKGNELDNTMTRQLDLTGATTASLSLKARYAIETDFDYLYSEVSTDGGGSWKPLDGTINGKPFSRDGSGNPALTGASLGQWVDMQIPLDAYTGKKVLFRFEYVTDPAVDPPGFFADDVTLKVGNRTVFVDGAEAGTSGWELDGFASSTGRASGLYDNYYIAVNRQYRSFDRWLKTGPYNFGFPTTKPNYVEKFSYQPGLLVTYYDTSQSDNNTSEHPGEGLALQIDAHPKPIIGPDGDPWRPRIQLYDATFGRRAAASFALHSQYTGKAGTIAGLPGQPVFDDTKQWWYASQPNAGVKTRKAGVRITVVKENTYSTVVHLSPSSAT